MARKHPERLIAFGSVNPSQTPKLTEKKLGEIEKLELKGIKLIPTLQVFQSKKGN